MSCVIDFQKYKERQPPPVSRLTPKDEILICLKADGTYSLDISGAYAKSRFLSIEHLADAIGFLCAESIA